MERKVKDANLRRRLRRAKGIKKRIRGTAECPRLTVFRSSKHIYAQLVDDVGGITLAAASTQVKDVKAVSSELNKTEAAEKVGQALAAAALAKGVQSAVFDRNGWPFHGRVAALAKGAREGGLKF
ncbi:MAG: 50S ribosomal protein L18 [Myxococcales bacterium]|nr:50S ribosomal protein L18 [Myxococcales bacterium]